jgi:hypothetical protein
MPDTVSIRFADLRWLTFALQSMQTRNHAEQKLRLSLIARFDDAIVPNPTMPEFALSFTREQMMLCLWAANEGRCRDGDEMLTRGRMQRTFTAAAQVQGVHP